MIATTAFPADRGPASARLLPWHHAGACYCRHCMECLPHTINRLETARRYWQMGLPIIPLHGKIPALKDPFHFERSDTSIRHWFGHRGCNIGLVTGDYVVIDSDTPEAERWIKAKHIDSPMMVRSGGGGLHRYFDGRGLNIRNWQGLFRIDGLDGRGYGGFIVFPNSIHPETGNCYEFLTELLPVEKLPPFRSEWITPIRTQPHVLRKIAGHSPWQIGANRSIEQVRRRIGRTFAISGSGGHNATFAVACELAETLGNVEAVLAELVVWNETNAVPLWSVNELEHKARDACKKVCGH